jgi:hypothetical protein
MESGVAHLTVRGVGAVTLACALYGLYYNVAAFRGVSRSSPDPNAPHFHQAFYVLSAICISFYVVLSWIGVEFILGYSERWPLFVTVLIAEIIYIAMLGLLWARSKHAMSIAAATGASSGGLMAQMFILLPIWGPVVVWLAHQSIVTP